MGVMQQTTRFLEGFSEASSIVLMLLRSEPIFGEGMRRSTFQRKKGVFSEKGGGNSVNGGFGKDFYRKGNSVKRSGPFSELPDSEK